MLKTKIVTCPICNHGKSEMFESGLSSYYKCDNCGKFIISPEFMYYDKEEEIYSAMYFYIMQHKKRQYNRKEKFYLFCHEKPSEDIMQDLNANYSKFFSQSSPLGGYCEAVTNDFILTLYPDNFNDRVDKSILNFGKLIGDVDGTIWNVENSPWELLDRAFFVFNAQTKHLKSRSFSINKIQAFIDLLIEMGYVIKKLPSGEYTLTAKGWQRIAELQRNFADEKQAFVAMWFDEEGSMDTAKETILNVIKDCGYKPMIISDKEHNNQIVPEIFYEIKNSHFVIADITGQRNGVYYEAGYAEALGKEVIVTCREDDFKNIHFDIAQKKMIKWKDEEDLEKQLKRRIEAILGIKVK